MYDILKIWKYIYRFCNSSSVAGDSASVSCRLFLSILQSTVSLYSRNPQHTQCLVDCSFSSRHHFSPSLLGIEWQGNEFCVQISKPREHFSISKTSLSAMYFSKHVPFLLLQTSLQWWLFSRHSLLFLDCHATGSSTLAESMSKNECEEQNLQYNKKAQLSVLINPCDAKACQNCSNSMCLQRCRLDADNTGLSSFV